MDEAVSYFAENQLYLTFKDVMELISYLMTILVVVTIFLGIKQLKLLKKDMDDKDNRTQIEDTIEVLKTFSSKIIPSIEKADEILRQDKKYFKNYSSFIEKDFIIREEDKTKELLAEVAFRGKAGIIGIFNSLELVCVYIEKDLVDEELVYSVLNKVLINFVEKNASILSFYRTEGAPYKNTISTYKKWSDRRLKEQNANKEKKEELLKEKDLIDKKIDSIR
ncbi:DUF4760 domain-containing protein [Listeria monocytogenes]|nr:hypothetical protein [Listeria monocytogenes]